MFKKLALVFFVATLGFVYYTNIETTPPQPVIIQPITDPTEPPKYEFKLPEPAPKPNEQTAPKEDPAPVIIIQPKKDKAPIRYDKNVERPGGYYDYCDKYPSKPECGAKK
jgi:hypothetical protein